MAVTYANYTSPAKLPSGIPSSVANQYQNSTAGGAYSSKNTSSSGVTHSNTTPTSFGTSSSASNIGAKQGSLSTAVVSGRVDAVPTSQAGTTNPYYTIYDGTNRKAVDSVTGKVTGGASGAKNTPTNYDPDYYGPTGGGGGSSSADYGAQFSALADYYRQMFDAQEKARKEKEEATLRANKENANRAVGWQNNSYNKNAQMIERMLGTGTNGALLGQQMDNALNRSNNVHDIIYNKDQADANGRIASYDSYANNIQNYMSGIGNLLSSASNFDEDTYRRILNSISI